MMIVKGKLYKKINQEMVIKHVEYIKMLDDSNKLELCGAFQGFPGMGGMIILKVQSYEEAENICQNEPFVFEGYATYKLSTLRVGNRENNYL